MYKKITYLIFIFSWGIAILAGNMGSSSGEEKETIPGMATSSFVGISSALVFAEILKRAGINNNEALLAGGLTGLSLAVPTFLALNALRGGSHYKRLSYWPSYLLFFGGAAGLASNTYPDLSGAAIMTSPFAFYMGHYREYSK